jgi:hypothetical protein
MTEIPKRKLIGLVILVPTLIVVAALVFYSGSPLTAVIILVIGFLFEITLASSSETLVERALWPKVRNSTSLSRMRPSQTLKGGKQSVKLRAFDRVTAIMIVTLLVVTIVMFLRSYLPFVTFTVIIAVVGFAAVTFSLLFSRRTFFGSIYLKTREEQINWQKYWELGLLTYYAIGWGFLVGFFFIMSWLFDESTTSFLTSLLVIALAIALFYSVVLWRRKTISQKLDEYHPMLAGIISENAAQKSQIRLPIRCHKGDSHNICLKLSPARAHKSDCWEAELQAAGVKVNVEPTQRNSAVPSELLFFWNCYFENAGTYLVNVLLRTKAEHGNVKREVLRNSHEIQVIPLYRQYTTTLVTVVVAVLAFLSSLHLDMTSVIQSLHF